MYICNQLQFCRQLYELKSTACNLYLLLVNYTMVSSVSISQFMLKSPTIILLSSKIVFITSEIASQGYPIDTFGERYKPKIVQFSPVMKWVIRVIYVVLLFLNLIDIFTKDGILPHFFVYFVF